MIKSTYYFTYKIVFFFQKDLETCLPAALLWPEDRRLSDARAMLRSSSPVPVNVVQRPEVSDHEFVEEQERCLHAICVRTMALPVGRGQEKIYVPYKAVHNLSYVIGLRTLVKNFGLSLFGYYI